MTGVTSFRDPAGYVSVTKDRVIRTVLPAGLPNLNACLDSPAARSFEEKGSLIATRTLDADVVGESLGEITVEHPRISFPSYPHEWPPVMLHAAAHLTLEICTALLAEGRGLKDATPGNILFRGARPVFIDVLSFEQRDPLDPIWLPDAQFARTFLIPLLLHRRTGYPIHELFLSRRDGIEPEEALAFLPAPRRWFPPDLGLVTLPARASSLETATLYRPRQVREAGEAQFILEHHFRSLKKKLDRLTPNPASGATPGAADDHHAAKLKFVEHALAEIKPARVLDTGSHSGPDHTAFSLLAAVGSSVVSIDHDPEIVSTVWRRATPTNADILPLVVDLTRPTPPVGWNCSENAGFLERAEGYFDCVFLLGLTHLMVSGQIPLTRIFDLMANLTTRWLLVEFVDTPDPLFRRLARGRDALYSSYSRPAFEECARRNFEIVRSTDLTPDRTLYLLCRTASASAL